MKKFIFMMVAMFTLATSAMAQDYSNYAGSSKFTDNWSVTLQGGTLTTFDNFYSGHTACAPIVVLGADKFVNPWLGFGVEGRTLIGTGNGSYNDHTAFDAVNVSGYVKFNVLNAINFKGTRRTFEPVVYTGLGWSHRTCSDYTDVTYGTHTSAVRNALSYRAGAELNFYFNTKQNEKSAWSLVVNPSVVWGDICNARLDKRNGNFEVTAGIRYTFKNSNGKRHMSASPVPALVAENAALLARVKDLENKPEKIVEVVKEVKVPATNAIATAQNTWTVAFTHDSAVLTDKAKATLDNVTENAVVVIDAYASREPKSNEKYNVALTQKRADTVKAYLEARGVRVQDTTAHGCNDEFGRVAVITVK